MTNKRTAAALGLLLGVLLASLSTTSVSALDTREGIYNVTTKLIDDVKESTFTMKLKARPRADNILSCSLYDPKYETVYHKIPCENSSLCDDTSHLTADSSYVGNFEIKFSGPFIESLTVSSGSSLKQLSFYRIVANHFFLGVDVNDKGIGTFPMTEESVYGKCEALVKIVRNVGKTEPRQTVSIKRTRNLETCHPMPGLLVFDTFFYHPMMASVHYDIKTSISRFIVSGNTFTSYTTEDIAMKVVDVDGGSSTTMLHVRTTLTLESYGSSKSPYPRIVDPVSVKLPFIDGFDPAKRDSSDTSKEPASSTPRAM